MYTTRRFGLGENGEGGASAAGGEGGDHGPGYGGGEQASAGLPGSGQDPSVDTGQGPGDFSPDVRADDPFSGTPGGPAPVSSSGSSFATRASMFSSAAHQGFELPAGVGLTLGIPGIAALSVSRDRIGVSAFGVGFSFSTRGFTVGGTSAPSPAGPGPSGGARDGGGGLPVGADGGPPGGPDWWVPSLPGLPPLAIVTPGQAGGGEGGVIEGLGAVTVPWLWLGVAGAAVVLARRRRKGTR